MDRKLIYSIREELENTLSNDRYQHVLGVEFTAASLAMKYGADLYKAELAGLLHDCAKEYSNEELAKLCSEREADLIGGNGGTAKTLHAVYGPIVAKEKYGVDDPEILSAIRWHTTGKADMSLLDKIVYVADFIEPCREMIDILPEVRRLAFEDITYALYRITEDLIPFVEKRGLPLDQHTLDCYNWLKENGIYDRQ